MARESKKDRKQRIAKIIKALGKCYPEVRTALRHSNPLQLLVATILSAQCTDARVNTITPALFKKYKTASDFAQAPPGQLEDEIRSTGFYRNKARNIRKACARIEEVFGGKVPDNMAEMLSLAGVARKTANVVLGDAYGKTEGIAVDTHVTRLSGRLKLTSHKNNQGDKIEKDLMAITPKADWTALSHLLIFHGRRVCDARKPDCANCSISDLCPSAFKL